MIEYEVNFYEQVKRTIKVDAESEGEAKLETASLFPMCHIIEVKETNNERKQ